MEDLQIKKHPIYTDYAADQFGEIYSLKANKIIIREQAPHGRGYLHLTVMQKGMRQSYLSHRFVYECFYGMIPKGMQINHIDCDKQNNRLDNLEVLTDQENKEHGKQNGILFGSASPNYSRIY